MAGNALHTHHPLAALLGGHRIILGSQSPRRVELLRELGLSFEVRPSHADESHPEGVDPASLPLVLSKRKADALMADVATGDILITADTIVELEGEILEKPGTITRAKAFLQRLSGKWHTVHSGWCVRLGARELSGTVATRIHFCDLSEAEIDYYLSHYEVLDKAGAYGIQDWIGLAFIDEVQGSYNNVIGLPTTHIYRALKEISRNPL